MNENFSFENLMQKVYNGAYVNQPVFPPPILPPHFHSGGHQLPRDFFRSVPPPSFIQQQISSHQLAGSRDISHRNTTTSFSEQEFNEFGNGLTADFVSNGDDYNWHSSHKPSGRHRVEWHFQNRGRGGRNNSHIRGRGQGQYEFRGHGHFTGNNQPKHFHPREWHAHTQDRVRPERGSFGGSLYSRVSHRNHQPSVSSIQNAIVDATSQQQKLFVRKVNNLVRNRTTAEAKSEVDLTHGAAVTESEEVVLRAQDSSIISCSSQRSLNMPVGQASEISAMHDHGALGHRLQATSNYRYKRWTKELANGQNEKENDGNQRVHMQEQLSEGVYECMVCCDNVHHRAAVWSCSNCYHVFHLRCIKQWARSSLGEGSSVGWRCPACQNVTHQIPNQYRCFCGKMRDPEYHPGDTPHSCGEMCNKKRAGDCTHRCVILCHPGPCPPCAAVVSRTCDCGSIKKSVKCSQSSEFKCDKVCGKLLKCGQHNCTGICHAGECLPCSLTIQQKCYGGHQSREVLCGSDEVAAISFSCSQACSKLLECGNHVCEDPCHPGECGPCSLLPQQVKTCCCGKTPLADMSVTHRKSCLDPLPTCDKMCQKYLPCGPEGARHMCQQKCHAGPCGECEGVTELTCVCGAVQKEFPCHDLTKFSDQPFKCEKRCNKKRMCGRHKCNETCCVRDVHICEQTCGRQLSCGQHRCEELCHRSNCKPCLQAAFDELSCHCGAEVIYPPVPCGTKPPLCHRICTRQHNCSHPVRHTCHSDDMCPPCTELVEKMCMGEHEKRKNIPCHMTDIPCGRSCGKVLACGLHKCQRPCHKGVCFAEGEVCKQPCTKKRPDCGHPCGAPCHADSEQCPQTPCKAQVEITCACKNRKATVQCQAGGSMSAEIVQFQKLAVQAVASGGPGQELDISHLIHKKTRLLECDAKCAILERNKRIAVALEIQNPDLDTKLSAPKFSDFLKDICRKQPSFIAKVEKALAELVQNAKQSKQPSRSYAFPSMNREQRRAVHELAEAYGCETQSYDYEPNKNVVATAHRNKCWLPSVTLTAALARKAPPPIPHHTKPASVWGDDSSSTSLSKEKDKPAIDYFDFSPK